MSNPEETSEQASAEQASISVEKEAESAAVAADTESVDDATAPVPVVATAENEATAPGVADPAHPPVGGPDSPTPSRKKRGLSRGALIGIVAAGVVVLLGASGLFGYVEGASATAPAKSVSAFLDAVKGGKFAAAMRLGGLHPSKTDVLMSAKAYASATDHVSGYKILSTKVNGSTATVVANIVQWAEHYTAYFHLNKVGKQFLAFDKWQLVVDIADRSFMPNAPSDAEVTVAGLKIPSNNGGSLNLIALPGKYQVTLHGDDKNYTGGTAIVPFVGFDADIVDGNAQVTAKLTTEGQRNAETAVDSFLDTCLKATTDTPPGCGFYATNDGFSDVTDVQWILDSRPIFSVGGWKDGGWSVTTTKDGSIEEQSVGTDNATGERGQIGTDPFSFDLSGSVIGFDSSGVAIYASDYHG